MHDKQLIVILTNANRERQIVEPSEPFLAQIASRPFELRVFGRLKALPARRGQITIGIAADRLRTHFLQTLEHLLGLGTVDTKIAGRDDRIRAALTVQVRQTGIESDKISVNVGNNCNAHLVICDPRMTRVVHVFGCFSEARRVPNGVSHFSDEQRC